MVPAQNTTFIDYDKRSYELKNVKVSGNEFSDEKTIIAISGLHIGQKISIPGQEIPQAIKSVYAQKLFSNVQVDLEEVSSSTVNLVIKVTERPRYVSHSFKGVKKSSHDELNDLVSSQINKNAIFTDDIKANIIYKLNAYYTKKRVSG